MINVTDYPLLVFVISFFVLWLATQLGAAVLKWRRHTVAEDVREDFGTILGATLALLGLLIGFSFSMATSRYDQRKNLEEGEANAIGTEYLRADLLPAADGARVRPLLRNYLEQRILFYKIRDTQQLRQISARTAQLQAELWAAVLGPAAEKQTPMVALAVAGMNDVLNSQGYTEAAWRNRIPIAAWILLFSVAFCCNVLIAYGARNIRADGRLLLVLPFVVSLSLFLIADIDSPRGGVIHLDPDNLASLAESLRPK